MREKESTNQVNGNMANSMEELKSLGKEMEQMREEHGTNGQGKEHSSDPIQFDEEEK